jgi:Flp pilus assembly protein TadG
MRTSVRRNRAEDGYVAIVAALLISSVLMAVAAIGVDVARWYVEAERVQTAADAAAMAGVIFLPDNLPRATETARRSAALNGYEHLGNATVTVEFGERRSQLRVTVTTEVDNQFGAAVGVDTATISRSAVADYTSPAPMGSPCNTFGNEPPGGSSTSGPSTSVIPSAYRTVCSSRPYFWAAIEGPQTNKQQGDRYSTLPCTGTYGCNTSTSRNTESIYPDGYFFAVKIGTAAVGVPVTVQLFDPAYYATGATCGTMPAAAPRNSINPYTTADAIARYATGSSVYCSGDLNPGSSSTSNPVTTSFALREQNEQQDPTAGAAISGCTKQFRGIHGVPSMDNLRYNSGSGTTYTGTPQVSYNPDTAKTFHQWYPLCTFTPTRTGDYYLQVRTNVALAGTPEPNNNRPPIVYAGNPLVTATPTTENTTTLGLGANSFGIRAVSSAAASISVSGWSRMPMLQNTPDSTASFNLLRVLPAAAGQSIAFEFFDVADGASATGSATVQPPADATGSVRSGLTGCTGALNDQDFTPITGCAARIAHSTHDGQVQRMRIPIPADYDCDETVLTGCWFKVQVKQNGNITDFTTWDASLEGDPVRLIE